MRERIRLAKSAYEKLKKELEHLVRVVRPANIESIRHAAGHGDLTENAAYQIAKEEQAMLETRIKELEMKLASAEIVDVPKINNGVIALGSRIKLLQKGIKSILEIELVDAEETDPSSGKVSIASPVGKALLGKKAKQEVLVKTPKSNIEYEIVSVD